MSARILFWDRWLGRLKAALHPILVFIGVQVAWIILMAVWIRWYINNRKGFEEFAKKIQPDLFVADFNWVILLEGCFLMMVILGGVYLMFVFWNKQARMNQMQSNFVSSVSHELKSPLASIQLYLETLKYQDVSKEEARDFVEIMLSDTERLSGLIENILEASSSDPKKMQLDMQPVDMGPFLQEVIKEHQRLIEEKKCRLNLKIEDFVTLKIDRRAMRMVFNNLLSNALRYSPHESTIDVLMSTEKKWLKVQYIDKGIGLLPGEIKKVFRKFYRVQTKQTRDIEGAGLGLFISKEIVKHHKGKIYVTSEGKDLGCQFTVLLPLDPNL